MNHYASFNRFEILLSQECVMRCSHQGQCDEDVKWWLENDAETRKEIYKIPADVLRDELAEYGAWDEEELSIDQDNRERILWIAAGDIQIEISQQERIEKLMEKYSDA